VKERLLQYLSCPACVGAIALASSATTEADEIIEGQLSCIVCTRTWPVVRGVPRFASPETVEEDKAATAANFGWQWQHFTQFDEKYEQQFLGWIAPVTPEFFKDKVVLEGGCGKGRHTQLAAQWGARDVIGIDLGITLLSAENLMSGNVWNWFMRNAGVRDAMERIGLTQQPTRAQALNHYAFRACAATRRSSGRTPSRRR